MGAVGDASATTCAGDVTVVLAEGEVTVSGKEAHEEAGGVGAGGAG